MAFEKSRSYPEHFPYAYARCRRATGDENIYITEHNLAFSEAVGLTGASAVGQSAEAVFEVFEGGGSLLRELRAVVENPALHIDREVTHRESGRILHVDAYAADEDFFDILLRDITGERIAARELHRQNKELMQAKADLDFLFNSTQDAMFMAEYTGGQIRYIRLNSAHERISGLSSQEIVGKTPEDVWGEKTGESLTRLYTSRLQADEDILCEETLNMGGRTRTFLTSLTLVWEDERQFLIVSRKDITALKDLQDSHLSLTRRLSAMFSEHTTVMLVIEPVTGKIRDANPAACAFYGYSENELLTRNIQDINMLPPEETARQRQRAAERRQRYFIFPHRLKGGEIRLVEVYSCPFEAEGEQLLYSIIFDVTDREIYKENLSREKELLNTTLRSIGDGVVTTDITGRITSLNKAAEEIVGWTNEEASGQDFADVFLLQNEETHTPVENPVIKVLTTGRIIGLANHTVLINRNGEEISIADSAAPILNEKGQMHGVVLVFRDVRVERDQQNEILYLSYHDPLTGLYNRRHIESEIHRLGRDETLPVSVIMGDVNGLKIVNDIFSHEMGDTLLRRVSEALMECGRDYIISRWGGDEFLLLMPGAPLECAESLIKCIKEKFAEKSQGALQLSVSLGYACKTEKGQKLSDTVSQAEEWMYHQKLLEGKSYRNAIINTLLATLYEKSMETEEHAQRLRKHCGAIARVLEFSDKALNEMSLLAVLHDIGKVGIAPGVLQKPCPLTAEEWKEMRKHPEIGYRIAQNTPELINVAEFILCHHERWDGKGYPAGLKGNDIPVCCRILAVADAYDAMTNDRAYRKAMPKDEAIKELKAGAGTQFDPKIVEIFLNILRES